MEALSLGDKSMTNTHLEHIDLSLFVSLLSVVFFFFKYVARGAHVDITGVMIPEQRKFFITLYY